MNIKKLFYFNFTIYFFIIFLFSLSSISIAANEPQIINKMTSAFESIEGWLLKLSTPAAAVAVGTGIFMKKFSFGDEEKIRTGKKIIRGSLFSYAFILAIDLILSAIKTLISWEKMDNNNVTQTIISTINNIFEQLFSSIDNNLYSTFDKITFINSDILKDNYFRNILAPPQQMEYY